MDGKKYGPPRRCAVDRRGVRPLLNVSSEPVIWLETFRAAAAENAFRFMAEWNTRAKELEG